MTLITIIFMALTFGVLMSGVMVMGFGNPAAIKKYSSKLMSFRVAFQALAIFSLLLVAYFKQ